MSGCKRSQLFLLGCITTRLALAFLAYYLMSTNDPRLNYLIAAALVFSVTWMFMWGCRLRQTGREAAGSNEQEGVIWWDSLRPIHAMMYLLFAVLACNGVKWAWMVLVADALFGLYSWSQHRLCSASFTTE